MPTELRFLVNLLVSIVVNQVQPQVAVSTQAVLLLRVQQRVLPQVAVPLFPHLCHQQISRQQVPVQLLLADQVLHLLVRLVVLLVPLQLEAHLPVQVLNQVINHLEGQAYHRLLNLLETQVYHHLEVQVMGHLEVQVPSPVLLLLVIQVHHHPPLLQELLQNQ